MNIKDSAKLEPYERYLYFVREREKIRLARLANKPKPWTDDEILQNYRFCNMRRMDDAVSQWLLKNWYEPYHGHKNMVLAAAMARFFNLPDVLGKLGFPEKWNPTRTKKILADIRAKGGVTFNCAYLVCGSSGGNKNEMVVDRYLQVLVDDPPSINPDSMEESWSEITRYPGFASFSAGQVVADLRWGMPGLWSDAKTWAPMGPGSERGMNRLLTGTPNPPKGGYYFNEELSKLIADNYIFLPGSITSRMEAIDWQNSLCEYDKFCRTLRGEGRPKRRFNGV